MSSNQNDRSRKHDRRSHPAKRRLKSSIVRDPNGSISTFRQFYQSGGRDYEQYRLWLQTLSNPSVDSDKIKKEPVENEISRPPVTQLPSTPRTAAAHSSLKPMPHMSVPLQTLSASHVATVSFESQLRHFFDHSSLPMTHWSVADVGRFIERHFPEKNISRKFIEQKIDGRTLPLLTEDHLTRIFKMKLGPALHLLALISAAPK